MLLLPRLAFAFPALAYPQAANGSTTTITIPASKSTQAANTSTSIITVPASTSTQAAYGSTATITVPPLAPSCAPTDYDCMTSYYKGNMVCTTGNVDCMVSAYTRDPAYICTSGESTDLDCITSYYEPCSTDGLNCMVAAYTQEIPESIVTVKVTRQPSALSSQLHQPTTGATRLPAVVTTMNLLTVETASIPSTVVGTVPSPSSGAGEPKPTGCAPGDQQCYNDHPITGTPPGTGYIDPGDDQEVAGSPIDDKSKIHGHYTPLVKRKHKHDDDDNSKEVW